MLQKSSAQLLGVTDKKDANGIGDNVPYLLRFSLSFTLHFQ